MDNGYWKQISDGANGFLNTMQQTSHNIASSLQDLGGKIPTVDQWIKKLENFDNTAQTPLPIKSAKSAGNLTIYSKKFAWLAVFLTIGSAGGTYYYYRKFGRLPFLNGNSNLHRRLAKRATNGGRRDVILIVGSLREPFVALVAKDLAKRGYIVYITSTNSEEASLATNFNKNVRPLLCASYDDTKTVRSCIKDFRQILSVPIRSFPNAAPHNLEFKGVLIFPDLFYPTGPLEALPQVVLPHVLRTKVEQPLSFLNNGLIELVREYKSSIVFVTPSNVGNIKPAFHAPESMVYGALSSLSLCLHRELSPVGVNVVHVRLGHFDASTVNVFVKHSTSHSSNSIIDEEYDDTDVKLNSVLEKQINSTVRADVLSWPESIRHIYGYRYVNSSYLLINKIHGTHFAKLLDSIADVIQSRPCQHRVINVGRGASLYDWINRSFSERSITWMLKF